MRLVLPQVVVTLVVSACAHTVTNEQRLDGMTDVTVNSNRDAAELRCRDSSPEVQIARDASQKKAERMSRYAWAIAEAKATQARFDEAFRKDPDLVYGPKGDDWKRRQLFCGELAVTLSKEQSKLELEADREPVVEKVEKKAVAATPAPAKKVEEKEKPSATASAADEAFADDADELRSAYKKKAKFAKAKAKSKKSRKHVIAAR